MDFSHCLKFVRLGYLQILEYGLSSPKPGRGTECGLMVSLCTASCKSLWKQNCKYSKCKNIMESLVAAEVTE
jgi:hypothetical protein